MRKLVDRHHRGHHQPHHHQAAEAHQRKHLSGQLSRVQRREDGPEQDCDCSDYVECGRETPFHPREQKAEDLFGIERKQPQVEEVLLLRFAFLVGGEFFGDGRRVEEVFLLERIQEALQGFLFDRAAQPAGRRRGQ